MAYLLLHLCPLGWYPWLFWLSFACNAIKQLTRGPKWNSGLRFSPSAWPYLPALWCLCGAPLKMRFGITSMVSQLHRWHHDYVRLFLTHHLAMCSALCSWPDSDVWGTLAAQCLAWHYLADCCRWVVPPSLRVYVHSLAYTPASFLWIHRRLHCY